MFIRDFITAVAFIAVVVSPPLLECTTCQTENQNDYVDRDCPVKLTVPPNESGGVFSECVTVHVWRKANGSRKTSIVFIEPSKAIIWQRGKGRKQVKNKSKWEKVHDCIYAKAADLVSVSYNSTSMSCIVNCTMPDPKPEFDLSVNQSSKSVTVTVESQHKVYARWCYLKNAHGCIGGDSPKITIDPSQSRSALLNLPYLLPCVCVQVFYTHEDALRHPKCPFQGKSLADVRDVWLSSKVTPFKSLLTWSSECPASDLKVSASLCWRQHEHLCTPVLNVTLEETENGNLRYNTSAVDKHPQMCVQFSLQGSHNISCPFQSDKSSWGVKIGPGRQSVLLYFTSSVQAKFSAQFCVLNERGCTPTGQVHFATIEANATEARMNVPLDCLAEKPCVQVWQSDPALFGRRILCPDYTHNRRGMYAVAALIFVIVVALLGIFIHRLTKSGAAGWFCIQKPVLLVCSSEQSAHVSAVCALASMLQGELSATVNMALWAQSSQTHAGVADLGPLPWLYGQWEAVRKAQGKMLIIWSSGAQKTYETWREERTNMGKTDGKKGEKMKVEVGEDLKHNGVRLGKCKEEKTSRKKGCLELCDDTDCYSQREPSTVIAPVFTAALACLEGALQGCKGQGVALVYFEGLCHSRDIPKAFRGVPRYCLPQDFRGLIQELGGMRRQTKTGQFRWHCWPRLLSKVLSIWLARRLAQRLRTLLPQTAGKKKMQSVTSSLKTKSNKTQSRLKLPLAAHMAEPETVQEHEPLHGSPWRAETL
uniref:interleukin-17 receptor C n=1 Tax=Semicossyphus pulcher TaxID=241346 RepID=UPI0037E85499